MLFRSGLTNSFRYAGFDLSVHITFTYGNYVLDDGERLMSYIGSNPASTSNNLRRSVINNGIKMYYSGAPNVYQFGDEIPKNPYPINDPMRLRATTRFLHDASFIRIKQVSLGYNVPSKVVERSRLSSVRVYVSASNLFVFSKFPGWDPEVVGNLQSTQERNLQQGITTLDFPQVKSFTAGVNIGF